MKLFDAGIWAGAGRRVLGVLIAFTSLSSFSDNPPINNPPTVSLTNVVTSVAENSATPIEIATINITDDGVGTNTLSLSGADHDSFQISNGKLELNPSATLDHEGKDEYAVTVEVDDATVGTDPDDTASVTVSITDVNESPTDIGLTSTSIDENAGANATVGTLSSSDPDSGQSFTYSIVSGGSLFNISGTTLRATSSFDYESATSHSVTIRTTDSGSPAQTYDESFTVSVNNVNEAPTDIGLTTTSIDENAGANATVGTLSSSDPDSGQSFTYSIVSGGSLFNISGATLRATSSFDYESATSHSVTIRTTDSGSPAQTYDESFTISVNNVNEAPTDIGLTSTSINENAGANATVGTLSSSDPDSGQSFTYSIVSGGTLFNISGATLRATSSFDYESATSHSVTIRTTDSGSPAQSYDESFTISVNNVNEAPTDIGLTSTSINENAGTNATVGTLSSSDPDSGQSFTYSIVGGGSLFNISGVTLRATSSFDYESATSHSVTIRTTDSGSPVQTYDESFTVSVNNVNEAPTDIGLTTTSIDENAGANATVGTLSSSDPDSGQSFSYSIVSGGSLFNISGATLRATSSFDYESATSHSVTIRTTDSGSPAQTYDESFTISVNNVNEAPTDIGLTSTSIDENAGSNATVGTLSSSDPDSGQSFTYSIVSGGSLFNISGATLRATSSFDYESATSHSVTIRTTDSGSPAQTYDESFTISVNNVNEAPTDIGLTSTSINENAGANATVGTLSSSDPDSGQSFTYSIVSGGTLFNISGATLRATSSFDYESATSHSVTIRTTDSGSPAQSYDESFTISVNNVNEAPTDIGLTSTSINENAGTNATVGTLSSSDPDSGQSFTYSIVGGGSLFNISGVTLRATSSFDYESAMSHSVTVRVTDNGSPALSYDEAYSIGVNNVNDLPVFTSSASPSISENTTSVTTVTATDQDNDPLTYSITGGADAAKFNLASTFGVLDFVTAPDFETPTDANGDNVYEVDIQVSDGIGGPVAQSLTVTVTDVSEAQPPTIDAISDQSLPANQPFYYRGVVVVADADTPVGDLTVVGESSNPTLIVNSNVRIHGSGAERDLELIVPPNHFGSSVITLTVSDGLASDETSFTYTVHPKGIPPADSDVDYIPDYIEDTDGDGNYSDPPDYSDVNSKDTDADGIPDGAERLVGFNPRTQDSDGDGVVDAIEFNNTPPTATADAYTVDVGSVGNEFAVRTNDSTLPDTGETLTITAVDTASSQGGAVTTNGSMVVYATPNGTFQGTDTFNYTINDGNGATAIATVTVTVSNINDPPGITAIANFSMNADTSWSPVDFTVSDSDGPTTSIVTSVSADNGTLFPSGSIVITGTDAARSLAFTPATGETGSAVVTLTADDGTDQNAILFQVNVGPTGLPPGDTDGDGLPDYLEDFSGNGVFDVALGESNWNDRDTEDDLLNDYYEYLVGANPNLVDTDGDGVSDYLEIMVGRETTPAEDWSQDTPFENRIITTQPAPTQRQP